MSDHEEEDDEIEEEEPKDTTQEDKGAEREEGEEVEGGETTVKEPEEILPDEKPWSGEADLYLGGKTTVKVKFQDPSLPSWIPYLVNDDEFYFLRTVKQSLTAGEDSEAAPPPPPATGEVDENGDPITTATEVAAPIVPFDPNLKFVLEVDEKDATLYHAKIYVPPAPVEDGQNDVTAKEGEREEGHAQEEEVPEAEQGEQEKKATAETKAEDERAEIFVDTTVLAANYSVLGLKYCLTMKEPVPTSLKLLEEWCLYTVGSADSIVMKNLIAASKKLQAELRHEYDLKYPPVDENAAKKENEAKGGNKGATKVGDEEEGEEGTVGQEGNEEKPPAPPPFFPTKLSFDFSWMFEKISGNPARYSETLTAYLGEMLENYFFPSQAILPEQLRNPFAVRAFVKMLFEMPRSLLVKWTAPPPSADEDTGGAEEEAGKLISISYALGTILLDLRRRLARHNKGKPDLRDKPFDVQKKALPKSLETKPPALSAGEDSAAVVSIAQLADPLAASPYGHRSYSPEDLELFMSDILLLALGTCPVPQFSQETFATLFKSKVNSVSRTLSTNIGMYHLLFHSINQLNEPCAKVLLTESPSNVFAHENLVAAPEWIQSCCSPQFPYVQLFAKQFWRALVHCGYEMQLLSEKCPNLHAEMEANKNLYGEFVKSVKTYVNPIAGSNTAISPVVSSATVSSVIPADNTMNESSAEASSSSEWSEAKLATLEASIGTENVVSPYILYLATESSNLVLVEYIFSKEGGEKMKYVAAEDRLGARQITALQHALTTRNVQVSSLLVHLGANLNELWDDGRTNGFCYIWDEWYVQMPKEGGGGSDGVEGGESLSSSDKAEIAARNQLVQDLFELWKAREHERGTDPSKKYGLLLGA